MPRTQLAISMTALLVAAQGCSRPDVPRIAMCAEQELEDGTVSLTGSTSFDVTAASIVSGSDRRLPADNGGGQCGDTAQRFEFEMADTSDRRFWFAISLFSGGEFERPDVPDLEEGVALDAQATVTFGFPDTGSIQVTDGAGLVFGAELNATNEAHELGGITILLGDETGPIVDAPCGINHFHSLRIEAGDAVVQVPTDETEQVPLPGGDVMIRNLGSTRASPDPFGCPPDSGGGNAINWYGARI